MNSHWAQKFLANSVTFSIPFWCIQLNQRWRHALTHGSGNCWLGGASQDFSILWEASRGQQTNTLPRVRLILSWLLDFGPAKKSASIQERKIFKVRQYQYTILQNLRRSPVKHASAVIFHFSLFKVEIFSLVIGETYWKRDAIVILVSTATTSTRRPVNQVDLKTVYLWEFVE